MQLDVELNMTLNGTAEEKYKMLLILKKYSDPNSDTDAHFDDMKFLSDNQIVRIDDLTDEDLRKYAKNQNGIKICAVGLNEDYSYEWGKIQIFHLMAEVVPDAVFEGRLDVETSYHKQSQTYCLANRKLEINTVFYSYESEFDDYTNYISKRLTWSKFKKWFQIDSDDLEKEDYLEFVSTYHYAFGETELAYEEWMEVRLVPN